MGPQVQSLVTRAQASPSAIAAAWQSGILRPSPVPMCVEFEWLARLRAQVTGARVVQLKDSARGVLPWRCKTRANRGKELERKSELLLSQVVHLNNYFEN